MQRNHINIFLSAFFALAIMTACTKKLDLTPTNDITPEQAYSTPAGYTQVMAKVYGAMATIGNGDPGSGSDISGEIISDAGSSDFLRGFWYTQSLSTDEAVWTWSGNSDPIGIHQLAWSPINQSIGGLYYRAFYQITLANDFIRQASDENLASRNISGADADRVRQYKTEARFLRAFQYWVLMDGFGNPPFVTENDALGSSIPKQIKRTDLFNYIESELKAIENEMAAPRANEYGRADRAAAWALLARIYLNAEVYTGTPRYTDAITYAKKVIDAGYSLVPDYTHLMRADNHLNTNEFIFAIPYDGTNTQNYGGTTMLTHGPSSVPESISGVNGSWNCIRITEQFVNKFDTKDVRGQFYTSGQTKEVNQLLGDPTQGYTSIKFRNITRDNKPAPHADPEKIFSDIDFPLFRLAEMYLIYAEAVVRGGSGGDNATALGYLQQLSVRARPTDPSAAAAAQLSLPYIIDERGRELFWECHRRTDLIRFNQFTTGNYLWAWKGGVRNGTAVDAKYNLFPIPSIDLTANPNLVQNTGY
jgi:hypothetical protein